MSFAYLPWFTGDYFRDTRHLSMPEHGAYLLMLAYCWDQKGPLPAEMSKIYSICIARSKDEQLACERVLKTYFVELEDGWYQPRMQREVERSEALSRKRSAAGRKGFQAKAKHLPSKSQALAKQVPLSPSPSPSPSPDQRGAPTSAITLGVESDLSIKGFTEKPDKKSSSKPRGSCEVCGKAALPSRTRCARHLTVVKA